MLRRMRRFAVMTRDRPRTMSDDPIKVWGAPEGWDAFLLAQRRREHAGSVLHVTRDDARMARLAEALAFAMPEAEILRFPAWDCLPYDRVSPNPALVSERIATLARLLDKPTGPRIVLTTVNALVQRVPPRSAFAGASMDLTVNGQVKPEKLARIPGSQRLRPRRHGDGAGRIRHARRHHRHFPGRREPTRSGSTCSATRSSRSGPSTRPRNAAPASAQALSLRPVSEVPLGQGIDRPLPHRLARPVRARTRRRTRCICRSPTGAAIPAWSTGCRCSIRRWKICWITCRTPRSAWITSRTRCWKRAWK